MHGPNFVVSEDIPVGYSAASHVSDGVADRGKEALSIDRDPTSGQPQSASTKPDASPEPDAPNGESPDGETGLDADNLSQSLRQAYESTLKEEIPDMLMDLLRKLD